MLGSPLDGRLYYDSDEAMKILSHSKIVATFAWALFLTVIIVSVVKAEDDYPNHPNRKIITFNANLDANSRQTILKHSGVSSSDNLNIISADTADISDKEVSRLRHAPGITRIEDDALVTTERRTLSRTPTPSPTQTTPWGVARVHAPNVWNRTQALSVKVGIIDTGVDLSHPDLAADIKGSYNAIRPTRSAQDDNGHGTHVAGILGALNNSVGVVGVGPQIDLYPIKVLSSSGSGYISDIIKGLDWAVANHIDIVNMSFGTLTDVTAFHDAIIRAHQAGIVEVAAAGNDGRAVQYPGAYPEVITVAASNQSDTIASFSSQGPQIALSAPGVEILSTYPNKSYKTFSGTSMATPHVTGAAALIKSVCNSCSPDTIKQKLESSADDIGPSGRDNQSGYGILNIDRTLLTL